MNEAINDTAGHQRVKSLAFARELDLFHLALAECFDPMIQAAHNQLIFDAACPQQLIDGGKLSAQGIDANIPFNGNTWRF
jgi:hypothetical protein